MKYFQNTSWMFAEQILQIISAIFVGIYVARYLGPEQFGLLSYALAVVGIFMVASRLGMDSILLRELVSHPSQRGKYIGTAFGLMVLTAFLSIFIIFILINLFESEPVIKLYVWIISTGLLFQTFLVIDYNFQAQVRSKYSSIAKSIALSLSAVTKIALVLIQVDLFWFAIAFTLDKAIIAVTLYIMHIFKKQPQFIFRFDSRLIRPLLKSAWPMVLAAVATMLYMRVDQIMIKNMLGAEQLGLYASATKIYEGWLIIPNIISISMLPAIIKLKLISETKYENNLSKLFALVFWGSIGAATTVTLFGEYILDLTFGDSFSQALNTLIIVMWVTAFSSLGFVSARYFTAENMEKKIAIRTFIALSVNILLNLIMIPIYGIEGAAISTLVCIIIANYLLDFLDSDLIRLRSIKNRAIFLNLA